MKRRGVLSLAVAVVAVAALAGLAWWFGPKDVSEEESSARYAGLVLSPADFPQEAVPPAEDAAPAYRALGALLQRRPLTRDESRLLSPRRLTRFSAGGPALRALLAGRQSELALARAAAGKPAAWFPLAFTPLAFTPQVFNPTWPSLLFVVRTAARFLRCAGLLAVSEGRYLDAVRADALALRVAAHMASCPAMLWAGVGCASEGAALTALGDILSMAGDRPGIPQAVRAALLDDTVRVSFPRVVQAETLEGLAVLSDPEAWGKLMRNALPNGGTWAARAIRVPALGQACLEGSAADYLHWMRVQLDAANRPAPARPAAFRKAMAAMYHAGWNPYHLFAGLTVPDLADAAHRDVDNAARRAILAAAAALLEYRARTGAFPARLSDAMAAPPDPWTGKPLIYRRDGAGFVVYSAGEKAGFHAAPNEPDYDQAILRYPSPARQP